MSHRILYQTDNGGVAVIVPSAEYLQDHTLEELAAKDVPPIVVRGPENSIVSSTPRPYQIVPTSEVPSDRTFREAWRWQD